MFLEKKLEEKKNSFVDTCATHSYNLAKVTKRDSYNSGYRKLSSCFRQIYKIKRVKILICLMFCPMYKN